MWGGNNYDGSYLIVLLLIIPGTISSTIQNIGIEIQRAKNMHKFRSWLYLFIAIGNLGISIPLAKLYGGAGPLSVAVAILIGNGFIMNWYYHVKVGINIIYFWKQILSFISSLVAPIVAGVLINSLFNLNNLFNFICFGIIYVIIFFTSMWIIGMNQYEKI